MVYLVSKNFLFVVGKRFYVRRFYAFCQFCIVCIVFAAEFTNQNVHSHSEIIPKTGFFVLAFVTNLSAFVAF